MTELSFIDLFLNASLLVKLVMLMLLLSSIVSWTFILQKAYFLRHVNNKLKKFETIFKSGTDLDKLYKKLSIREKNLIGLDAIFVAGFKEFNKLYNYNNHNSEHSGSALLEGLQRAMKISLAKEEASLESNLPFLATVQSISPYIGLFGTVWGIMLSLKGLGAVQQATIATVAPGISEALIATAMGLIAAIPAGIAYNRYINTINLLSNRYRIFIEEFTNVIHRKIVINEITS